MSGSGEKEMSRISSQLIIKLDMVPQKMKFGLTIRIVLDFEFSGQQAEGIL